MKYQSKSQFIQSCEAEFEKIWELLDEVTDSKLSKRVASNKGGSRKSIKDALAHLHAWHRLLLDWHKTGLKKTPMMPAKGFKWSDIRALNKDLFDEFKDVELASVKRRLGLSHGRVMKLALSLSEKQLLKPGQFDWTGKYPLTTYMGPNTASHYRWAQKEIKRIKKLI